MRRDVTKVVVGAEHDQFVAKTQLGQERIDRSDLDPATTAEIAQFRRLYVIVSIRRQQRQHREPLQNGFAIPRAGETLQQFLQNQAGDDDGLAALQRPDETAHCGQIGGRVASESQRPDAGINEEAQPRERSCL